jgi:hypothetical protein
VGRLQETSSRRTRALSVAATIRPEDNDVLIERQRMELFPVQSLTDQYLADLDDLADSDGDGEC